MIEILFQFSITFTIKVLNRNKFDYLTKLEKEFCDIESELEINFFYFFKLHLIDSLKLTRYIRVLPWATYEYLNCSTTNKKRKNEGAEASEEL